MQNPYDILGVSPTASESDIRQAYRKLAKTLHPDLNPGDKNAEEKFKEVSSAYSLLSDKTKRARFDAGEIDASGAERPQQRYYRDFAQGAQDDPYASAAGYEDFLNGEDLFADMLRRSHAAQANRSGEDLHFRMPITLAESISGGDKRVTMPSGSVLDVKIPPGVTDGQVLRLKGKGAPGRGKGGAGDALIEVEVLADSRFQRDGDDLHVTVPISLTEAVLGASVPVDTPTGKVMMTIPKGSNTGNKLRLKGKGAPKRGGGFGDEYVSLDVKLPPSPDPELQAFVESWSKGKAFNPRTVE